METRIETGTVVRISGGRAAVRMDPRPEEDRKRCHGCTVCRSAGDLGLVLSVGAAGLAEGDCVKVAVPTPSPWRGIALVLALPLALGMAGLLGGAAWADFQQATGLGPEGAALVLGGGLGLAALALAVGEERRFARRHQPRILEVHRPGG
jgi:hypothetical protein